MKLRTIWMRARLTLSERYQRTRDRAAQRIVKMLPRRVRYWTTMADLIDATSGYRGEIPAMPLGEVLRALPVPKR